MASGYKSVAGSFLRSVLKWSLLASMLFLAYENRDVLLNNFPGSENTTGITGVFNTEAEKEAVELTPERTADYFLYVVAPKDALRRGDPFTVTPQEMKEIRQAIIQYESSELEISDIGLYLTGMTESERSYARQRVESLKADGAGDDHAILRAAQELLYRRTDPAEARPITLPLIMIETAIRNMKYQDEYGHLSHAQAAALVDRYKAGSAENVIIFSNKLDYLTDRDEMWRKGMRGYRVSREFTVRRAEREAQNGTIDETIRQGKEYYEQNRSRTSALLLPAGQQAAQPDLS